MFKKTKVRGILELLGKGLSARLVSCTLKVSRNTVALIQAQFEASGKTWDDISCWDDEMLYTFFYPEKFKSRHTYVPVDYAAVHRELMKTGVTETLLWEEYSSACRQRGEKPCSYLTFTRNYRKYTVARNYTSRVTHKPGVAVEVDWSGSAMSYADPDTGRTMPAFLVVATMPYSQKSYVEATADMKEKAWLSCHVHMFEFFGGTPLKIVCDNLKTGVTSHPANGDIMLELSDLARIIETHGNDLKLVNMPFNERMEFLLTLLVQERENRLVDRLIRNAGFKYPMASLESLDFESRQIKKEVLVNLVGTAFVANATNIFITGPTGAGKTYLSCALGIEACRQRFRTLYIRMPDLLRHFESNRDNRMLLARYRKQLCNYQLLIIDEWLNYKVSENDAKILYELFDGRCEKNSTIFVGQFPPDEWHGRLGGGTQADSIMDRIIYNTFEIPAGETNLRKIYESRKLKKLMTAIGE